MKEKSILSVDYKMISDMSKWSYQHTKGLTHLDREKTPLHTHLLS